MSAFRAQNPNSSGNVQITPHHTKKAKNLENLPLFNFYYGVGSVFDHATHTFELDFGHEKCRKSCVLVVCDVRNVPRLVK